MTENEHDLIRMADSCVDMIIKIKKSRRIMARFLRENLDLIYSGYVKDKVRRKYVSDLKTERICNSVKQVIKDLNKERSNRKDR